MEASFGQLNATSFFKNYIAERDFLDRLQASQAECMPPSQISLDGNDVERKPFILPASAFLVIADPGRPDCTDDAEISFVLELRTHTCSVSDFSSLAAAAIPDIAKKLLALLSNQTIKARTCTVPVSTQQFRCLRISFENLPQLLTMSCKHQQHASISQLKCTFTILRIHWANPCLSVCNRNFVNVFS